MVKKFYRLLFLGVESPPKIHSRWIFLFVHNLVSFCRQCINHTSRHYNVIFLVNNHCVSQHIFSGPEICVDPSYFEIFTNAVFRSLATRDTVSKL